MVVKFLTVFAVLTALVLLAAYLVYRIIFSNNKRFMRDDDSLPKGEQYAPYLDSIRQAIGEVKHLPFEDVFIKSCDGLALHGKYYEAVPNAPVIIFFHGYRCSALRDGNGVLLYARRAGYNTLMADLRAHGQSQGKTISFGIRERFDCKCWADYVTERFGFDTAIVLAGLSMGAATVMMASDLDLPSNVKGIIADCGYSSPKDIIKCVMHSLKFPVSLTYPLAKLGARLYGHFDLEEYSAKEALRHTKLPVLLIHGDDDRFVPCSMSRDCYDGCGSDKSFVVIESAGHGLCYCVNSEKYEHAVDSFLQKIVGPAR